MHSCSMETWLYSALFHAECEGPAVQMDLGVVDSGDYEVVDRDDPPIKSAGNHQQQYNQMYVLHDSTLTATLTMH